MNLRAFAPAAGLAFLIAVSAAADKPFPFPDLKLGAPVSDLIKAHGSPSVVTTDVGHVWTWDEAGTPKIRLTTDDTGAVDIIDVVPKSGVTFVLPAPEAGTRVSLALGALTLDAADASTLARMAEAKGNAAFPDTGTSAQFRAYRISPATELVLLFSDSDKTLGEAFYGNRDSLARGGLLPAAIGGARPSYTAPAIVHLGAVDYPVTKKQGDAFVRIEVKKDGSVGRASIYVSTGDATLDAVALRAAMQDTFTPAKRGDDAVDSVFFHKEEFRTLPPLH